MGDATKKLLIIDTDPGVDDAMAIFAAFNSPEVDVIGLTTLFGNVKTSLATENALRLRELAGREDVPVIEGSSSTFAGVPNKRVADFVHGQDGFGNTHQPRPKGSKEEAMSAAEFIQQKVNQFPGRITILALASLTNVALALSLDETIGSKWAELVYLGGAFFRNGNVNPAAEANTLGDPEAADYVFALGNHIKVVGLDVTVGCQLTAADLDALDDGSPHGRFLHAISQTYHAFYAKHYGINGMCLHDPTAFVAVIAPEFFKWTEGSVRVSTEGITRGMTIMDAGFCNWVGPNAWSGRPRVQVALGVDETKVVQLIKGRICK
ncbi:unnamed protein product [Ostreobium quekettii]|uniref:Inosine/uridine-preferring nucleoside hydrolase domain-containing protein n=1 Tax=Ostreobium quekettii TaxID=121088 RepID=A0A8S1JFR3_9CHLO|nr:unnamed protein product [Ostreobium quekettii]